MKREIRSLGAALAKAKDATKQAKANLKQAEQVQAQIEKAMKGLEKLQAKAEKDAAKAAAAPKRRGRKPGPKPAAKKTTGRRGRPAKAKPVMTGDDLTRVKGVGAKVADMLKANGVDTFKAMAALSVDQYKELLKANDMSKFRNPTTWAAQAAELAKG